MVGKPQKITSFEMNDDCSEEKKISSYLQTRAGELQISHAVIVQN